MSWEGWLTIVVVLSAVGMLSMTRVAADVALIAAVCLLMLLGVLTPREALAGMANEGMLTVAVLYVVVAGLRETGGIAFIGQRFLGRPKSVVDAQLRMLLPITTLSAILNNTPLVAMMIPVVSDWAKRFRLPVSKLMIPLSYAAILGGTCTLIGTSTNLVVNGMMLQRGMPGQSLLDIAWVGVPNAIVGLSFMILTARWLLPNRGVSDNPLDDPRKYTVEMVVQPGSPLVGKTIELAGLRHLTGMFLIEIDRHGMILPAVGPQEVLEAGDRLVFAGIVESVVELQKIRGLEPATDQVFKLRAPRRDRVLIEAVVSPVCPIVGKTIREGKFRSEYNAVVIAVARHGQRIDRKIGDIELEAGDTLLVEAHPSWADRMRNTPDFCLISPIDDSNPPRHEKAPLALLIMAGMVLLAAFEVMSMFKASILAAGMMLVTRCCAARTARRSVDWEVLLAIAASFGLGSALEKTGASGTVASQLIDLGGGHPWLTLALFYGITLVFTELVTNNAAAALMFPIALSTSTELGVSFMPFAVALMVAASNGFATPLGYQTHLMVYGPGGYRFSDFFKAGIPLDIVIWIMTVLVAPLVWPF